MLIRYWSLTGLILFAGLFLSVPLAQATLISFDCITNNNAANAEIGMDQLSVEVTAFGTNQVLFTFFNVGNFACSITDVYFDNQNPPVTLSSIYSLIDRDNGTGGDWGVDFSVLASPRELPGANNASPAFVTTTGFSADSDSPVPSNGVNPGETLGIVFNLLSGETFDSVIAAMSEGDLRIGLHVQGFSLCGGSESFVNINPPDNSMVPEPGTIGLVTMGLISVISMKRRRMV